MKILIIDDSLEDRSLYKKYIENSEYFNIPEIEECDRLSLAFDIILKNNFDVILLDLKLPETEGIETVSQLLKELHKMKEGHMIKDAPPVVVLTGSNNHSVGRQAFNLGIKDFLVKQEINQKELTRSLNFATYSLNFSKATGQSKTKTKMRIRK